MNYSPIGEAMSKLCDKRDKFDMLAWKHRAAGDEVNAALQQQRASAYADAVKILEAAIDEAMEQDGVFVGVQP